ncbi:MAG: redoxin domain-containing protein [Patescibacteria group bacterium]|nr:redoxin domain-containing protein [Patescibacteria group bacterium]
MDTFTVNVASLFRGDAAPDFEFQTADGRTHRLSEYRGRKVVLRFGDKWDAMDGMGDPAEATERLLSWYGGGPIVWINLTSDTKPRPTIEMVQDAEFQYVQGYVPPTAEAWKAYDVHRPRSEVTVHVAQDGTVITK